MKIGILGSGDVGQAIGRGLVTLGHDVHLGSRAAANERALVWARAMGPKASVGTFADSASFGELVVLATLGIAADSALAIAGLERFRGKVVIDATNPLAVTPGVAPALAIAGEDSGGERVQRLLPEARVVKAFNTVGFPLMFRPELPGGPPDMFIAGNDAAAKAVVTDLLKGFGWGAVDTGGIASSRYLEAMCLVWILSAATSGNWNQAFKMLRK